MYSEEFREEMVAKLLHPRGPTVMELSADTGVSEKTLYDWKKKYGVESGMTKKYKKSPRKWTAEEKMKAIIETHSLDEQELGAYVRRHGFTRADLERWKKEVLEPPQKGRGRPKLDPEVKASRREVKDLKRDLRRKEKALAEATALLVLKKKAELIWGVPEDDESE